MLVVGNLHDVDPYVIRIETQIKKFEFNTKYAVADPKIYMFCAMLGFEKLKKYLNNYLPIIVKTIIYIGMLSHNKLNHYKTLCICIGFLDNLK